jgi:hypothetical protein
MTRIIPAPDKERPGGMGADESRRSALEANADLVRAHLLDQMDLLRERTHRLLDPAEELKRHTTGVILAAAAIALMAGGGGALLGYRMSTRKERARRLRIEGWVRLFQHPERAAPAPQSFAVRLLERAATATVTAVLATIGKRYVTRLMATRAPKDPIGLAIEPDPFPSVAATEEPSGR